MEFLMSLKVDGESFERAMSSGTKNEYTVVLFYASWCPFSSFFQSKFSTLSSMYPQVKHLMVEQTSVLPRCVFLCSLPIMSTSSISKVLVSQDINEFHRFLHF